MNNSDFLTYARYAAVRDSNGTVTDLTFIYANSNLEKIIGEKPTGSRSKYLPIQNEICKYAQNVLDIMVPKCFSYHDDRFGTIHCCMEPDECCIDRVHVYTIDICKMNDPLLLTNMKKGLSTLLGLANVSVMHMNINEHYIYNDNILTADFKESNPDLYIPHKVMSTHDIINTLVPEDKKTLLDDIEKLKDGQVTFISRKLTVINHIGENIPINVTILEDDYPMYLVAVQYLID